MKAIVEIDLILCSLPFIEQMSISDVVMFQFGSLCIHIYIIVLYNEA